MLPHVTLKNVCTGRPLYGLVSVHMTLLTVHHALTYQCTAHDNTHVPPYPHPHHSQQCRRHARTSGPPSRELLFVRKQNREGILYADPNPKPNLPNNILIQHIYFTETICEGYGNELTSLGTMRRSKTTTPWGWMLSAVRRLVRMRSTEVRLHRKKINNSQTWHANTSLRHSSCSR